MILYNTTFCVDEPFENELVDFIKEIYIPSAYACGMYKALLTKIRAPKEQNGLNGNLTVNYALQLRAPSDEVCRDFSDELVPRLFESMGRELQQALNVYCTTLDVVHDHDRDGE